MLKDPSSTRITIDKPPLGIIDLLKSNDRNSRRRQKASAKASANVDINTFSDGSRASAPIINVNTANSDLSNILMARLFGGNASISTTFNLPVAATAATARTTPAPSLPPEPPSSPISHDTNITVNEYIDWLINREPPLREELENTRRILLDKYIPLEFIYTYKHRSESEWERLGITAGIGWRLAQNIKLWQREQGVATSRRRTSSPPSPPLSMRSTTLAVRPSPRKNRGGVVYQTVETQETQEDCTIYNEEEEFAGASQIFTDHDGEV